MTNILLITADDMDARTPGAFGGDRCATPRLDALASAGMSFRRSHVPIAVCQPSRSAIMTGCLPHRNGAEGFGPIADGIGVLTDHLHEQGFSAGILGKVDHIEPVERFKWDFARSMSQLGLGRSPEAYGRAAREFIAEAAEDARPWFLMANAHDPHRPFHGSEDERAKWSAQQRAAYPEPSRVFSAEEVEVPGFLPDLPEVRREVAQYLSSARRCDDVVGEVLDALEDSGQAQETIVVFLSDNGMAFPFAKANCYLRSTSTPLIVAWPGRIREGAVLEEPFVSTLDLFPTFCEIIGSQVPEGLDGCTLMPLLEESAGAREIAGRDRVHTVFHETSAKRRYEMRCVQTADWGYVWNSWSDGEEEYRAENMQGLSWGAMVGAAEGDDALEERTAFYLRRAPEELYDLRNDPDCLENLAGDPARADDLLAARTALRAELERSADPLLNVFATI
ncbi:sulfatase [Brachybacterium sp. MASK1Z-5]|uniref:Sulfatase n=1 Tax=Brachybacterium halotolerans TaxID=2795215 RepID=A0ABS1B8A1_9MICO|nr:sulfatase [Brachybacterium halotolerans]MBK0330879.1 sulfatase [Brachybacterium halotolerans]